MSKSRRNFSRAAVAAWFAALAATGAAAQDSSTIGPPQLKDFQLQASPRPAPPRPAGPVDDSPNANPPAAARQAPPPVVSAPPPSLVAPPAPAVTANRAPAPTAPAATAPTSRPEPRREAGQEAAPSTPDKPGPATTELPPPSAAVAPLPTPSAQPANTAPVDEDSGWSPWLLLLLVAAAGAGFVFLRRRRRDAQQALIEPEPIAETPTPVAAAPVARAAAPRGEPARLNGHAAAAAPAEERAWLEVEFKPSRAAATDKEAIVHYELLLRNVGKATARNIRIDTKLFNAGAEADIKDFLAGAIHEQSGSPHVTIPSGEELRLGSAIAIAKEDVREIVVEGRSLFVPAVAINVAYNWAPDGTGRTSKSWLVGREAEQPSQKMGAFRLDLGPRIYRSVGQRQTGLAQMV